MEKSTQTNRIMCAVLSNFETVVYEDLGVAWRRPMVTNVSPGKERGQFIAQLTPILKFGKGDTCPPFSNAVVATTYPVDELIEKIYREKTEELYDAKESSLVMPSDADVLALGKAAR